MVQMVLQRVCSFNGIYNAATGSISIINNTVQKQPYMVLELFMQGFRMLDCGTINITGNNI
jgi:hypothetical protein